MEEYLTKSADETKNVAKNLAHMVRHLHQNIIALTGDLGSGKTTFVQGFAEGLKIKDKIISPTFVLIRIHKIPKTKKILYHVDLYRLDNPAELQSIGLSEIMADRKNIVLIEWAEKIEKLLPKNTVKISLEILDYNTRKITVERQNSRHVDMLP